MCVSVLGQYKCNSSSLLNHRQILVTYLTCQTCVHPDFTMARVAPILILYFSDLRQCCFFTCQTRSISDFLLRKTSKIALKGKKLPKKTSKIAGKNVQKSRGFVKIQPEKTSKNAMETTTITEKTSKIAGETSKIA